MAANVNIYVAGAVVAGALANRRRRAANLMRVPIPKACQPSRNGRDRPGIDPLCPVSRARLILPRTCEN